jgi:hypothetical protein
MEIPLRVAPGDLIGRLARVFGIPSKCIDHRMGAAGGRMHPVHVQQTAATRRLPANKGSTARWRPTLSFPPDESTQFTETNNTVSDQIKKCS